jgi:trans-aconitate methyltransferase
MKTLKYTIAKASYCKKKYERYDKFNENNSRAMSALLEKILKESHVVIVLDFTCGAGSQVFWLKQKGADLFYRKWPT